MMKTFAPNLVSASRVLLLLAFALFASGCAQSLMYYPDHVLYDTPKRAGLAYEEVTFQSRDGTRLSGWFIPAVGGDAKNAKGTVIHFHGNAQNMSAHWQMVEWLPARGFNLFVFDYRGYGISNGEPDAEGVFEDANSALDYVRSRPDIDPDKLLLLGQSLGGANAIATLGSGNRKGVKAIAVESSFYSYFSIANDKIWGAGILMNHRYSPDRYIAAIAPVPLLLLHGSADQIVPFEHANWLLEKANEPKRLVRIEGGEHIAAFSPQYGTTYQDMVSGFFEKALKK